MAEPALPADLKPISPYLTRAKELATAEPVISYWSTYYAVQHAMRLGAKSPESSTFLFGLMDRLEEMKAALSDNEAATDDAAAAAYVENFAVKLFVQADNEDRSGKGTRLTAKKFLAAANFLELLSVFGEISSENLEKIKYSKWKAADIAKAYREGRKPTPGPAGGLPAEEEQEMGSAEVTGDEARELARELAALGSAEERTEAVISQGSPAQTTRASVAGTSSPPAAEPEAYPFPDTSNIPLPSPGPIPEEYEQPTTPAFPSFLNTPTTAPGECESLTPTPPAATPSELPPSHQTSNLAPPPPHAPSAPPAFPSAVLPAPPALPQSAPFAPPAASAPPPLPPAPPVTHTTTTVPDSLDPMVITSIQKHARWAISALNYDDLDTARKELRAALAMLGG